MLSIYHWVVFKQSVVFLQKRKVWGIKRWICFVPPWLEVNFSPPRRRFFWAVSSPRCRKAPDGSELETAAERKWTKSQNDCKTCGNMRKSSLQQVESWLHSSNTNKKIYYNNNNNNNKKKKEKKKLKLSSVSIAHPCLTFSQVNRRQLCIYHVFPDHIGQLVRAHGRHLHGVFVPVFLFECFLLGGGLSKMFGKRPVWKTSALSKILKGFPPRSVIHCGHFIFRYPRSHLRNQNKWIFHHKQLDCRPKIPKNLSHGCLKIWGVLTSATFWNGPRGLFLT